MRELGASSFNPLEARKERSDVVRPKVDQGLKAGQRSVDAATEEPLRTEREREDYSVAL